MYGHPVLQRSLSTYLACVCDIELLEKRFDVISKCLRYLALPLGVVVDVTFRQPAASQLDSARASAGPVRRAEEGHKGSCHTTPSCSSSKAMLSETVVLAAWVWHGKKPVRSPSPTVTELTLLMLLSSFSLWYLLGQIVRKYEDKLADLVQHSSLRVTFRHPLLLVPPRWLGSHVCGGHEHDEHAA